LFISGCTQQGTSASKTPLVEKQQTFFTLTDIDNRTTTLNLENGQLRLDRVVQPYLLLHLFSTRVDLCRAMLPYLSDLQRKHSKDLFVLGIVLPERLDIPSLRRFMRQNDATFFVSGTSDNPALGRAIATMLKLGLNYPLPLTVLFHHGQYVTHYEGITPIEMIQHDLNALKTISGRH